MYVTTNSGLYGNRPGRERYTLFESVQRCKEVGFEGIDVNFFTTTYIGLRQEHILEGDEWRKKVKRLAKLMEELKLFCNSSHAPYRDPVLCGEKLAAYECLLYRAIEGTAIVGAKYMVVHPLMDQTRDTLIGETISFFRPWAKKAQELGVTLAMENMFSTCPEQLLRICDALECAACWDTGHAHIRTEKQSDDIRAMGSKLQVLHIHDNYGTMDNHNPPYFGNIDWQDVLHALRDIDYQGTFNYEVNLTALPEAGRDDLARYLISVGKQMIHDYFSYPTSPSPH